MKFKPLSDKEEYIAKQIVDAAFTVHKKLGPGLLERVYEICFCHELSKRGFKYQRQVDFPIVYDGIAFKEGLRLDVIVEENVISFFVNLGVFVPLWQSKKNFLNGTTKNN